MNIWIITLARGRSCTKSFIAIYYKKSSVAMLFQWDSTKSQQRKYQMCLFWKCTQEKSAIFKTRIRRMQTQIQRMRRTWRTRRTNKGTQSWYIHISTLCAFIWKCQITIFSTKRHFFIQNQLYFALPKNLLKTVQKSCCSTFLTFYILIYTNMCKL